MTKTPVFPSVATMNPVERRIFIKSQLELRGLSFAAIARREGCSRNAVGMVAAGMPSARLQEALAEAIEVPVEELFPERYDSKGRRTAPVRPGNISRSHGDRHGQKAAAA